jgi:hypothetical protein
LQLWCRDTPWLSGFGGHHNCKKVMALAGHP